MLVWGSLRLVPIMPSLSREQTTLYESSRRAFGLSNKLVGLSALRNIKDVCKPESDLYKLRGGLHCTCTEFLRSDATATIYFTACLCGYFTVATTRGRRLFLRDLNDGWIRIVRLLFEGGVYSRAGYIRGRSLFEEIW